MGVFAENQPIYASHNIPTFPVEISMERKKPSVANYGRIGLPYSTQLVLDYPEINALAFMAGKRSKITVVDIDSPDEDLLRDSLGRYGDTPIIVRSGSGNFHAWYRHNEEVRKIRPDTQVPVDILGGGVVIAPPSQGATGAYEFIRGNLADLHNLRSAANIIEFPKPKLVHDRAQIAPITEGHRNDALFRHLMQRARNCDNLDALEDEAFTFADNLTDRSAGNAFTDAEIRATAKSTWDITARGDNRFGQASTLNVQRDTVMAHAAKNPHAFALLSILQAQHKGLRNDFILANAMADSLGWSLGKFRSARDYLVEAGLMVCLHPGGRGPKDPPVFRF